MENDDALVGRVLSRRETVKLLAPAGAAALVGCNRARGGSLADSPVASAGAASAAPLPGCVVRPELTVGPYFVDKQLDRSDIRVEPTSGVARGGLPLALAFNVNQIANGRCAPLAGAMVDVWHCDADGVYSGVADQMVGFNTVGQKFLRGYQVTDGKGVARFTTIYPGWYQGRATHIHAEVTINGASRKVTQIAFPESVNNAVHTAGVYASRGTNPMSNTADGIFADSLGSELVTPTGSASAGYAATFQIAI